MSDRLKMARIATQLQSKKTDTISLELLLSTTAVATTIVLAAHFNSYGSFASSVLISPAELIKSIKESHGFIDDTNFVLDQTCLEHGLITIYLKFLTATKGFSMKLVRGKAEEPVAGMGEWKELDRAVSVDSTKLVSYLSLTTRYGIIIGESVEKRLVRYIGLVRDELLASASLQPSSLSEFCREPQVLIDLLMKQAAMRIDNERIEAENEFLKSQGGQFNEALKNTLRAELKTVHDVLITMYGTKTTNMSKDPNFLPF